ncbi:MAG: ArsA-related P-loop ATPase [Polyangiales bacterium]
MIELSDECRLAFCVGVGGVGKTTFAAALALREAMRGRSVLVLTADPARRLADALGVHGLRDAPSEIRLPSRDGLGALQAAMLETKASADEIIRRAAADDARAQRVLDNRIYLAFANTLARSHAYAAMERVHEALHDPRYDLVVVDTPPAQSSIEMLDAPLRLVQFLDQRVVRWFLTGSDDASPLRGGALTQRLLRVVAGDSLVAALTEFLTEMAFLRDGFSERAGIVRDLMRSSSTKFVLVSSADLLGMEAANSVADELDERGFELAHVVFNRAFISEIDGARRGRASYPERLSGLAPKLEHMRLLLTQEQDQKQSNMIAFCGGHGMRAWALPEATRPLGDTSALIAWIERGRPIEPPS